MMRRGYTLIEVMVVSVIMLLLLGVIYAALSPGLRAWARGQQRSDMQQGALLAFNHMQRQITSTWSRSISIIPNQYTDSAGVTHESDALTFLSPYDKSNNVVFDLTTMAASYQAFGVYYVDDSTQTLRYQTNWLAKPSFRPAPYQLTSFAPNPQDRIIARFVSGLTVQGIAAASGTGYNPLVIDLQMQNGTDNQDESSTVSVTCAQ